MLNEYWLYLSNSHPDGLLDILFMVPMGQADRLFNIMLMMEMG